MEKISLPIKKKIYKKLNTFFQPLGYETPIYWYDFVQQNPNSTLYSNFYFEFNCFKNKYEIDLPIGAYVFDLKVYLLVISYKEVENIIDSYIKDLQKNGVYTANIQRGTIIIPQQKIYELDTLPILKIENRYYLENELDEFIEKLTRQITEVVLPYARQFDDIQFLDKTVNASPDNYTPLTLGDYGVVCFKKMIIAKLASNPDFEIISSAMKNEFLNEAQNGNNKRASNWNIALSLFDEMYEKIKAM